MDTGGFFVALLHKVKPIGKKARERALALARELRPDVMDDDGTAAKTPEPKRTKIDPKEQEEETHLEAEIDPEAQDDDDEMKETDVTEEAALETKNEIVTSNKIVKQATILNRRDRNRTRGEEGNEDFIVSHESIWPSLVEYYGLSGNFPKEQYMARSKSNSKVLYFVGKPVTNLMGRGMQDRLTIINAGLKGFERNSKDCGADYRITQEGIQYLLPYMTKRKIIATVKDFELCIAPGAIPIESFSDKFAGQVRDLIPGSFVVLLEGFEDDVAKKMALVMWKCRGDALNCLVAKIEMDGMNSKLRAVKEKMGIIDEVPVAVIQADKKAEEDAAC
jgi:hypothetical protein